MRLISCSPSPKNTRSGLCPGIIFRLTPWNDKAPTSSSMTNFLTDGSLLSLQPEQVWISALTTFPVEKAGFSRLSNHKILINAFIAFRKGEN